MTSVIVLPLLFCCFSNRKSGQGVKDQVGEEPRIELDEIDLRDPPPAYDSVMATDVGSLAGSDRTAVEPVAAEESEQHESGEVPRERTASVDGDVSPVTPIERDSTRPW